MRLRVPDIKVAMESREFEILQDAVTHVCLAAVRLACSGPCAFTRSFEDVQGAVPHACLALVPW